jgi:NAD(P)-dependent dehydrogenase (short-subunit alcohol dehydrogenase family)
MNKSIFITGISSGIGRGLSKYYLKNQDFVYGISRRNPPDDINTMKNLNFSNLDVTDFEKLKSGLELLFKETKSIDLIILNAGILPPFSDLSDTSMEIVKKVSDVNIWSNKIIIDTLFNMQINIAQVVAISSGASISGSRGWNVYSISKAALNMMIKLYAAEFTDCHFSSLAPGLVDTAMMRYLFSVDSNDSYPSLKRIQEAEGTEKILNPEILAPKLDLAFKKVLSLESGIFVDIREMSL